MTPSVRIAIAAFAAAQALAASPLAAQVAITPNQPAENSVGPAQLRDFSLDGEVVRAAEPEPGRSAPAANRPLQSTTSSASTQSAAAMASSGQRAQQLAPENRRQQAVSAADARGGEAESSRSAALDLREPSPAVPLFRPLPEVTSEVVPASSNSGSFAPAQSLPAEGGGFSPLPWLFVILLGGGAAAYYLVRRRSSLAFAGGPGISEFVGPSADPSPQPTPPRPAPTPPPPAAPVGIVSTRLRPWLDIKLNPVRLTLDGERAALEFEVVIANSGSGPAREILLEALMFNAGPDQDKDLAAYFARPTCSGEPAPLLEPLKTMAFKSIVYMPRTQIRQFKAGDRTVFVPVVGFNLLYRWSGGGCQTSEAFLIGKDTGGAKLAPFRTDSGDAAFDGLGARKLEVGVRR